MGSSKRLSCNTAPNITEKLNNWFTAVDVVETHAAVLNRTGGLLSCHVAKKAKLVTNLALSARDCSTTYLSCS